MIVFLAALLFFLAWVFFILGIVAAFALDRVVGASNKIGMKRGLLRSVLWPFSALSGGGLKEGVDGKMVKRMMYLFFASIVSFLSSYLVVLISAK